MGNDREKEIKEKNKTKLVNRCYHLRHWWTEIMSKLQCFKTVIHSYLRKLPFDILTKMSDLSLKKLHEFCYTELNKTFTNECLHCIVYYLPLHPYSPGKKKMTGQQLTLKKSCHKMTDNYCTWHSSLYWYFAYITAVSSSFPSFYFINFQFASFTVISPSFKISIIFTLDYKHCHIKYRG